MKEEKEKNFSEGKRYLCLLYGYTWKKIAMRDIADMARYKIWPSIPCLSLPHLGITLVQSYANNVILVNDGCIFDGGPIGLSFWLPSDIIVILML